MKQSAPAKADDTFKKRRMPGKLVGGVETPAVVMLTPVMFTPNAGWYSGNGQGLCWGLRLAGTSNDQGNRDALVAYAPVLVPRVWDGRDFVVVVEHETESKLARYGMRLSYGCADPSEFVAIQTRPIEGHPGKRVKMRFTLDGDKLLRGELLRVAMRVDRHTDSPLFIYGAWLELEV